MLSTHFTLTTLFVIELASVITPFLEVMENISISKSSAVKNKKLIGNAVYVFEKRELPLCSRRYQKISNKICAKKDCQASNKNERHFYNHQLSEQELRDLCVADFHYDRTS